MAQNKPGIKDAVAKEYLSKKQWEFKYGDLQKCYIKLQDDLKEISNKSGYLNLIRKQKEQDNRQIKIPPTTNGMYGLLAKRKDFKYLDCPDIYENLPLPKEYHLVEKN
ncbi:unnamed protein product [Brassicogethes aeneus]|uniref:Uncharacterized protein n=1 Tax=Brassicogethes aeneus TaxID=1431903 RepID=A0A9P0AZC2_BRAAE|nr:unnamed protein product [Brassicogethes aeneus]